MIGWVVGDGGVLMAARHAMAGAFRQRGEGPGRQPHCADPSFCSHLFHSRS
jgi:hypothetical protein